MDISLKTSTFYLDIKTRIKSITKTTVLLAAIFCMFIGSATYFAVRLKEHIIPDEAAHFTITQQFATTWGIPKDVPETYQYGFLGHRPNLYYWINGRALNGLSLIIHAPSNFKQLFSLRMLGLFYSILTVWFCYLLAKEVIQNRWWQLLAVFLLTNTLMFVFLSGGASYDNLANLCSIAGTYYLIRVYLGKDFYRNSLAWMIWITAGTLTKITILPLALITFSAWAIYVFINRKMINFRPVWDWKLAGLLTICVGMLAFNFSVYGVNLIRYKAITPPCNQILPQDACDQNLFAVRDKARPLPEKKLTALEIIKDGYQDPVEYFLKYWFYIITVKIFGIMGHKTYYPDLIMTFYTMWISWVLFVAIRYWKKSVLSVGCLVGIFLSYSLVLFYTNYDSELTTHFRHYALQGRYIFPVIGVFYVLAAFFLSNLSNNLVRRATVVLTVLLFLSGGPVVTFLRNGNSWHPDTTINAIRITDEIDGKDVLSQGFVSECTGSLKTVAVRFNTFFRPNTKPVIFRLVDPVTQKVYTEQTIAPEAIPNTTWHEIPIPNVALSPGREYLIQLTSPESVPGNAFAVWRSVLNEYPDGRAMMNGKPVGGDMTFRYECYEPLFYSWFR